jgi:hypothetical protein
VPEGKGEAIGLLRLMDRQLDLPIYASYTNRILKPEGTPWAL